MKTVSQLDLNGYLVGSAIADESPLEEGVFLLPAGCIDLAPIDVPVGQLARFDGMGFVLEDMPEPVPVAPVDPAIAVEAKLAQLRAVRELILNRLGGIAGRSQRKEDSATAAACDVAAQALLDITKGLPCDLESIELTVLGRYQALVAIAIGAAPGLVSAFAGVDL